MMMRKDTASLSADSSVFSTGETTTETGGTNTNKSCSKNSNSSSSNEHSIARRENTAVSQLRVVSMLALVAAGMSVSLIVFFVSHFKEINDFEGNYEAATITAMNAFESIVEEKLGVLASLAVATTSYGIDLSKDWPLITLSSFHQKATAAKQPLEALYVSINPYISEDSRSEWEQYIMSKDSYWVKESIDYQISKGHFFQQDDVVSDILHNVDNRTSLPIYYLDQDGLPKRDSGPGPYMPTWQHFPVIPGYILNHNILRKHSVGDEAMLSKVTESAVLGKFMTAPPGGVNHPNPTTSFFANLLKYNNKKDDEEEEYQGDPMSNIYIPVFDNFENNDNRTTVAVIQAVVNWRRLFHGILPPNAVGLKLLVGNSCNQSFTFEFNGDKVDYIGPGHLHDPEFDPFEKYTNFDRFSKVNDGSKHGLDLNQQYCPMHLRIYPTSAYYRTYSDNLPNVLAGVVAFTFVLTLALFMYYDHLVEVRQNIVYTRAKQTTAIVSSLFPKNVTDRLLQLDSSPSGHSSDFMSPNQRLKSFVNGGCGEKGDINDHPIADLFPEATVFFSDIAGFTAWSSTRDPTQVFILLQTVYQAFDDIATRRKVFKVETIGDSYVAVTGVPEPQSKHAIIMARFAAECLQKMNEVVRKLEVTLGPDTADLSIRVGLHSGPVTAGVLRGQRSRFQLFGDTVNTAARMESTGLKGKIQISDTTAGLIMADGKSHWVISREDVVEAKGKGTMKTFWLRPTTKRAESLASSDACSRDSDLVPTSPTQLSKTIDRLAIQKRGRLVDWICELLLEHMQKLDIVRKDNNRNSPANDLIYQREDGKTNIDEVEEVIILQEFDANTAEKAMLRKTVEIPANVQNQLEQYITTLAALYHDNPFHNFDHACHVTLSVSKLLKRIVTPDIKVDERKGVQGLASQLHDYTYGITSDPLAVLAILFSAVIHDADHRGCSNVQLAKEEPHMAQMYRNQSIAEQNSLDIAWDLLMTEHFNALKSWLFCNKDEMMHFRQVLVNVVLATDIFDKELNDKRKQRWQKAFHDETISKEEADRLRGTIVIEHIIQASDVSHTMQHWHIYRKWNRMLFLELRQAYSKGRMGADPADFWYKGEIGFFDNYVIPLAKKLKECNVFGVSSDEFLNYALKNRDEWVARGEEIVAEMIGEV